MIDLKATIKRCLESCNPPVTVYSEDDEGSYHKIRNGVVADVKFATEHLHSVLESYLKNEEEQGEIDMIKSDNAFLRGKVNAYEKYLMRNGIIADVEATHDEEDEQIEKRSNNAKARQQTQPQRSLPSICKERA